METIGHSLVQHAPEVLGQVILDLGYLSLEVFVSLIEVGVLTVYLSILTVQLTLQLGQQSLSASVLVPRLLQSITQQLLLFALLLQQHLEVGILLLHFVVLAEYLYFLLAGLLGVDLQFPLESTVQLGGPLLLLLQLTHLVVLPLDELVLLVQFPDAVLLFCDGAVFGVQFVDHPV